MQLLLRRLEAIFRNACIESSLFSLRILKSSSSPRRRERITASHYHGFVTPGAFLSKAELQRINDHLSRLT